MSRTFFVCDGRTVTLPQGLQAGPGATMLRCEAGTVLTFDDAKCIEFGRFINGRVNAGDLAEIDPRTAAPDAPAPVAVKHYEQRDLANAEFVMDLHGVKEKR